ncbi:MAG: peptidyl-prolyl cis-trans isomerase [Elusimicrobiota bacterium]
MKRTILLAAVFALCATGLQAATVKPEKSIIAVVNGKTITAGDLTTKLWWQHGAAGLSELIDEKLVLDEAARLNIKADPKEVEARITALSADMDKEQFEKNLKSVGWTDADLKDLFTRQLTVRDTVTSIKKVAVTDEDVKNFFDTNKEKLVTPEAVKVSQIFVNTQAEADAALESLAVGADFGKLSAMKSADPKLKKDNGSLGYITKGTLLAEIEKELFSLEAKKYSKVFPTGKGFSVFYVEEHRQPQPAEFEKIKDELKVMMLNQALSQKLPELAVELRQKAKIEVMP